MPKKNSISVVETDIHFGDTIHFEWETDEPDAQALVSVQAATGGQITYVDLNSNDPHVVLGPTPTWSEGPGTGTVQLVTSRQGKVHVLANGPGFAVQA